MEITLKTKVRYPRKKKDKSEYSFAKKCTVHGCKNEPKHSMILGIAKWNTCDEHFIELDMLFQ